MMLFPGDNPRTAAIGVATGSSTGTNITASASVNTKGSWTELTSSLPFDIAGMSLIGGSSNQFSGVHMLVDIGIGAAGSEAAAMSNIYIPDGRGIGIDLPLALPKTTRVTARIQATVASAVLQLGAVLWARGEWSNPGYTNYAWNADETVSRALQLTDPGAANVKGAWTGLIPSLPFAGKRALILATPSGSGMNADTKSLVDIGIGALGSEVVAIPNIWVYGRSFSAVARQGWISMPVNWARGSRISARFQSANGNSADRGTRCQVLVFG